MANTNLPQPQSYQSILGSMIGSYNGSLGVNDSNAAAANIAFFQIVALMAARSSGDIFQILRDYSLDRATGSSLDRLGTEYGVPRKTAKVTTGFVTVIDTSFQKISTKIYAGLNPPLIGATTVFVSDASLFPASGGVYIGRGTADIEGPLVYGTGTLSATGNTTASSKVIGSLTSTAGLLAGYPISGSGISAGAVIVSVDSSSQITISIPANTNATGVVFAFSTPPVQVGSYWAITLVSPTTKYHNLNETVILAQGGVRTVPINTIVIDQGIGAAPDVQFSVTQQGIILDGETTVANVAVTALLPGASGNAPAGAITEFSGPPFKNATVTNPLSFTTGADTETDDDYRIRIKLKLSSTGLGTVTAIESALLGVQDPNSAATIVSTDVLNSSGKTIVYVDDGNGYEATNLGVGIESIVDSALGGEQYFQLVTGGQQTSVTKAHLQTVSSSPFNLSGGEVLEVVVGNITYQHTFASTDFQNPGSATAYEVTASINADTLLAYEAVTSGGGTYVVIRPIDEVTNTIQVQTPSSSLVVDANGALQFPSNVAKTLRLYKNGILLTEDGSTASIFTQEQSLWSATLANGETISLSVDGTQPITYTLTDADFLAEGTYQTLSSSNSLQSWVNVFNNVLTGVTATLVGSTIELTSNLGAVDRAQVTVVNTIVNPTSLIGKGVISNTDLTSTGVVSDYILDRNTAQIQLATALVKGDKLSAGTLVTQATIKATSISSGSVDLSSDAHIWVLIDSPEIMIPTIQSGSQLSVSVSGDLVTYTSSSTTAFSNVIPGDYVIIWSAEIPATDRLEGRVHSASGSFLTIKVTAAEAGMVTPVSNALFVQGFVVTRTQNVPQKFRVQAGTKTLDVIAAELQTQTDSVTFTVFDNTNIVITTNTDGTEGELTIVTADTSGQSIGFVAGNNSVSQDALIAFYETKGTTSELPLFFHSTISADSYAEPIDSYLTNFTSTLSLASFDPNEMIQFLNPYGTTPVISGGSSSTLLTASAPFALLASSSITNTGASVITGNVGLNPGSSIIPGGWTVVGTIDIDNSAAIAAQSDASTVYTTLAAHSSTTIPSTLDGQTLTAGYYSFSSGAATLATSGPATLTFSGSATDIFVIKTASTLTTGAGGTPTMTFTGGAVASNVYWIVGSSATINVSGTGAFEGTIIANTSITADGGSVNGRLFALGAAITISAATNVTVPAAGPSVGTLTKVSGTGDATITFSAFTSPTSGQFTFTTTSANATSGAVYSNNGMFFTVSTTIVSGTTLTTTGISLIDDEQPSEENVQISAISGTAVTILPEFPDVRRLRIADRYFVANPLDFGYNDTVVAIVDNNTAGETYTLPLYRRAIVNSIWPPNNYSFDAYDVDAGPTTPFSANFTGFDFSNFKVLMKPKFVLQGSNAQTALLYRSTLFGRSGQAINVSYVYPTSANQPISSTITVTPGNQVSVLISLLSGAPIASSITASTQWNVTVTANTPSAGIDQLTFKWAGQYIFTVTAANATAGAVYTNNGQNFTVATTISAGTTLTTLGSSGNVPLSSGTLTKVSGTGDATIAFSSFSFVGTGTNPALFLSGGEYVTILSSTGFSTGDTGTFRVSTQAGFTPTSTSFSVQIPTGTGVAQSNVVTGILNGISFYTPTPTTAAAINTYVNANLSQYFTTTIVNDGGTTGSGIIVLSSFEDSGFIHSSYFLKDGINWISSSNTTGNPQFTLKEPLTYTSDTGYSFFTSGEEIRLIPTTMDQVQRLWSVLAVTGFTTVGTIEVVDRGTKIQLATETLGSVGSIQIVGGSGNEYSVPVLTSGELLGNNEMSVSANSIASQAMTSDQWFRLQAANYQTKDTGISNNTSVTVLSNTPTGGQSTVTLLNQESSQLYFGSPRNGINIAGDTFRVEKQGLLACLSWNGVGASPGFSSAVNFNDFGSWTVNVSADGTYTSVPTPTPPPSPLGSAAAYGILAASAITNSVGTSTVNGNLGEYPGSTVTGAFTVTGATNLGNSAAHTAQNDALSAYTSMQTLGMAGTAISSNLDGQTLTPGNYKESSGTFHLASSGPATLTFNGAGTYIIYAASTLTTGAGGVPTMVLTGGATAANIFWIVGSSATINSGSAGTFEGNIVAQASITDTLGGIVNGSLIALTAAVTLSNTATINSQVAPAGPAGNANFAGLSIGDLITISGLNNPGNNGTFFVTGIAPNGLSFTVSNPSAVVETGTVITAGEFTASSSVSEGDTMILSSPFSPLNQGEFRVIRRFNDSVWYENSNVIEEEITCSPNVISTGFDSTTVFNVTTVGGTETLSWNGTGTPPFLGLALPGDVVTFSSGFQNKYIFTVTSATASVGDTYTNNGHTYTVVNSISSSTTLVCTGTAAPTSSGNLVRTSGIGTNPIVFSAFTTTPINQGNFMVVGSGPSQQQIVQFTMPSGVTFPSTGAGSYFEIWNGGNANKYYVWYNVSGGSNTDPAPAGFTGIEVTIIGGVSPDSAATVASKTNTALSALVAMTSTVSGNVITVTATVPAATHTPVNVSMPAAFSFTITQFGQTSFLSVINPSAVPQTAISSVTFSVSRPQIQFFPYEATVPGDKLSVNGTVLGAGNAGNYNILQVLSPTTAIISGVISQQFNTNLAGNFASLSVEEGTKYAGYKQVAYVAADPGSSNFNDIIFNTSAQYEKIDLSAGVVMTSLSKLNFPTTIRIGIDAYDYDTGLIGEGNRVVYGDPRDQITYPGNNAAGTDIFIREPLIKRVTISLAIRTNIGVSFSQITQQIQSSVYSLIQSNPLGTNLDLSEIITTVRSVPGVTSCVIVSPVYNVNNDEILLSVGQKAFVIQLSDISVSLLT